jgi:hypothetical protein
MTDEGHIRDALERLMNGLFLAASVLKDMQRHGDVHPYLTPLEDASPKDLNIWQDIKLARDHIDAIRVRGDAARKAKEASDDASTGAD